MTDFKFKNNVFFRSKRAFILQKEYLCGQKQ